MGLRKGKKKDAQTLPAPGLPLPPLPGMPLPPLGDLPTPLPLPGIPAPLPLPDNPAPALPMPDTPVSVAPTPDAPAPADDSSDKGNQYGEMWAKRSNKPLQQIYGHIDRLAKKETGSLLDRYSDRFGHSLDREIIVLRKKEHDSKVSEIRDAPVVQLLDDEDSSDLKSQLTAIENELRALKPEYQAAKANGDSEPLSQIRPVLEGLMAERKSIKAMMDGTLEPTVAEEAEDYSDSDENDELFASFVAIVDDLLGSKLSEDVVSIFLASDEFEIYQEVGSDPLHAEHAMRVAFVSIVDEQLGNMSPESVVEFTETSDFEIYKSIATLYQSDENTD
ncbi:MAG: hypothetical protein GWP25_06120 [Euryarchaeota archaeon]|nr:hypothetical protein [Euryarchaeota archaeon]